MSRMESFPYLHPGSHHPQRGTPNESLSPVFAVEHVEPFQNNMATNAMYGGFPNDLEHSVTKHHVTHAQYFNGYPMNYIQGGAGILPSVSYAGRAGAKMSSIDSRYHNATVIPSIYTSIYNSLDCHHPGYRKNVTKETTGPLKSWLLDHRKNPYPSKAEKIMLAIITKMTLTQVSTWFANARRRLKKETGGSDCDITEDDGQRSSSPGNADRDIDQNADMCEVCVDDVSDAESEGATRAWDHNVGIQSSPAALRDTRCSGLDNSHFDNSVQINKGSTPTVFPDDTNTNGTQEKPFKVLNLQNVNSPERQSNSIENPSSRTSIWSISDILGL